jgi:hypothetical protein
MTWQVTPSRRGAPVPPSLSEEGAPGSVDEGVRAGFFLCAVSATTRANPSPGSQAQLWLCARRLRAPGRGPEGPFARSDANDPFETSPPFKRASRTPKLFVAPDGASRRCRPRIMGAEHTVGGYFTLLFIYQSWAKPFAPCDVDVQLHSGRES